MSVVNSESKVSLHTKSSDVRWGGGYFLVITHGSKTLLGGGGGGCQLGLIVTVCKLSLYIWDSGGDVATVL